MLMKQVLELWVCLRTRFRRTLGGPGFQWFRLSGVAHLRSPPFAIRTLSLIRHLHISVMSTPTHKKRSELLEDLGRFKTESTPRLARLSQSGVGSLAYEAYGIETRREWLRSSTTCFVVEPSVFLDTFVPKTEQNHFELAMAALEGCKILRDDGWRNLNPPNFDELEHNIYNEPVEKIVNTIINALPVFEGGTPTHDTWSGSLLTQTPQTGIEHASEAAREVYKIRLQNDGFRSFQAERPDVTRSDGALLFLHQAKSSPAKSTTTQPTANSHRKAPTRKQPHRMAKIRTTESSDSTETPKQKGPIHLEDAICCLQFKRRNTVSCLAITCHSHQLMCARSYQTLLTHVSLLSLG
jgi:hypothetical protein